MPDTTPTDLDLLARARQGDPSATAELYRRHADAARRLASAYRRVGDPDDLVNDAFERVLGALERGSGPVEAFRAYLFVTLRRLAAEQAARSRDEPTADVPEPVEAAAHGPAFDPADRQIVLNAYQSLPDRWQSVLWHTAVEGRPPRDLAPVLGMSANAVAALASRAREKLREAYLQAHLQTSAPPECLPHRSRLGAYVRDGLSRRDKDATEAHMSDCSSCRELVLELSDVNQLLVRALHPLFLSVTEAGTLAAGGAATTGLASGRRLLSKAGSNPTVAAAVVVAAAALAAALVALPIGDDDPRPELAAPVDQPGPPASTEPDGTPEGGSEAASDRDDPAVVPAGRDRGPEAGDTPDAAGRQSRGARGSGSEPEAGDEAGFGRPPADDPSRQDPHPAEREPDAPGATDTPPSTGSPPVTGGPAPTTPPTTATPPPTEPPPPPEPPDPGMGPVVWLADSGQVQISLTNRGGRTSGYLAVRVTTGGGAVVDGWPTGCQLAAPLLVTAACGLGPLPPGGTALVRVPVAVTGAGQTARVSLCAVGLLTVDCNTDILATTTVALTR